MADSRALRFSVDGKWRADEWSAFIGEVSENYSVIAMLFLFNDLLKSRSQHPQHNVYIDRRTNEIAALLLRGDVTTIVSFLETADFAIERDSLRIAVPVNLQVLNIKFSSPGNIDFLGLGKIAEALASFYKRTLDFIDRRWRTPEERLRYIEQFLTVARERGGLSDEELRKIADKMLAKENRVYPKLRKEEKIPKSPSLGPKPKSA